MKILSKILNEKHRNSLIRSWNLLIMPTPDLGDLSLKIHIAKVLMRMFCPESSFVRDSRITQKEVDDRFNNFLNDEMEISSINSNNKQFGFLIRWWNLLIMPTPDFEDLSIKIHRAKVFRAKFCPESSFVRDSRITQK